MAESSAPPPAVVLDTSVVIKWIRQEEVLADQALALREAYLDGRITLAVPTLLGYELANVLRFQPDLLTQDVQSAIESLYQMRIEWVPPSSAVICRAVELARTYETTVYETTFAALAESLGATFVTADDRLARRLFDLSHVQSLGNL